MKRLLNFSLLAAAALSLASCASNWNGPKFIQRAYFVDYQQAAGGKVFITESNSVSFDYVPVGSLLVEEIGGKFKETKNLSEKQAYRNTDPVYGDAVQSSKSSYRYPDAESALDYAANKAIEMGGDGIINLQMTSSTTKENRPQLIVTGMVIKRK